MKRKWMLIFIIVMVAGMTACSSASKKDAISTETNSRQETATEETASAKTTETIDTIVPAPKIAKADENTSIENDKSKLCDPMVGIVEKYEDNLITIKDPDDDMLYYFFTENAQILEGFSTETAQPAAEDFPIAVGDKVEISYRGTLDDKEHPTEAVKIVVVPVP